MRGLILLIIWDHTNGLVKYGHCNNPKVGDYRPILDSRTLIHSSGADTSRFYLKMPTLLYSNLVYSRIQTANQLYSMYNSTISQNNTNPYWIARTFWLWRYSLAPTFIARLPVYKKSSSLCTWPAIGMVTSPCMHIIKIKPITWGQPASMEGGHTRSPKWNAFTPSPIGWSSPLKQGHAQWMVFCSSYYIIHSGKMGTDEYIYDKKFIPGSTIHQNSLLIGSSASKQRRAKKWVVCGRTFCYNITLSV